MGRGLFVAHGPQNQLDFLCGEQKNRQHECDAKQDEKSQSAGIGRHQETNDHHDQGVSMDDESRLQMAKTETKNFVMEVVLVR